MTEITHAAAAESATASDPARTAAPPTPLSNAAMVRTGTAAAEWGRLDPQLRELVGRVIQEDRRSVFAILFGSDKPVSRSLGQLVESVAAWQRDAEQSPADGRPTDWVLGKVAALLVEDGEGPAACRLAAGFHRMSVGSTTLDVMTLDQRDQFDSWANTSEQRTVVGHGPAGRVVTVYPGETFLPPERFWHQLSSSLWEGLAVGAALGPGTLWSNTDRLGVVVPELLVPGVPEADQFDAHASIVFADGALRADDGDVHQRLLVSLFDELDADERTPERVRQYVAAVSHLIRHENVDDAIQRYERMDPALRTEELDDWYAEVLDPAPRIWESGGTEDPEEEHRKHRSREYWEEDRKDREAKKRRRKRQEQLR